MVAIHDDNGLAFSFEEHRLTGCRRRPVSMRWISDDLIEETRRVWSSLYEREVTEFEAVEMSMNVKRLAEVLLKQRQGDCQ